MARTLSLLLPGFQRFDCEGCTYCCRSPIVMVTHAERDRILQAGWAERLPGQRLFHRRRWLGRRPFMIAHRPDGACVFLGEDNRCRLHAETGLETKPLPCRLFPFVPVPACDGIRLDVRCDCPSAAANKGRSLSVHAQDIANMLAEMHARPLLAPPAWRGGLNLSTREFATVTEAFVRLLRRSSLDLRARLRAGCLLIETLSEVRPSKVRGERFVELMAMLSEGAATQAVEPPAIPPLRQRSEKMFGQWLFLHAVTDDPRVMQAGRLARTRRSWRRYGQSRAFARGQGPVPEVCPGWPRVTFEQVKAVQPAPDEALEPICRFIHLKLDAHAFAGPAYYGYNVIAGLTALWLFPALAGFFARLRTTEAGRDTINADDVLQGVRTAAATFGTSPDFARLSERMRVRALAEPGVPSAFLARYGA